MTNPPFTNHRPDPAIRALVSLVRADSDAANNECRGSMLRVMAHVYDGDPKPTLGGEARLMLHDAGLIDDGAQGHRTSLGQLVWNAIKSPPIYSPVLPSGLKWYGSSTIRLARTGDEVSIGGSTGYEVTLHERGRSKVIADSALARAIYALVDRKMNG